MLLALLGTLSFLFGPATPLAAGPVRHTLGLLCIGLALAGLLAGLWRWWSTHRLILRRLERLTTELTHLRGHADLAGAITEDGRDEVTALAHGLNLLLQQVARTQATRSLIEKQFQESEQRYRMLFNGTSEGFALFAIVVDAAGQPADYRFLAVNPAYARLAGLQDGALVGRTLREVLPGVEPAQLERYRQVALSGAPAYFTTFDAQGHRHFRINASRPAPDQLAILIEDTTEQVQRDVELQASGERFRQLTTLAPVGVFLTDPQGHCDYVNDKWLAMTALSFSEVVGDSWLKTVHPDDRARVEANWKFLLHARGGTGLEYRLQQPDGAVVWVYGVAAPLRDAEGQLTGCIGILLDITTRKQSEQKRVELDARLQQTQKLESLGVLAGGIAHDFNNILMAVLGNVDLALLDLPEAHPARVYLADVEKATCRAAELCRQMLAYSGKGRFVIERVNLNDVIDEMARMLEISVSKKATLRYGFAANLPPIEVDVSQLQQIIMNLVINASEAIGERNGTISIVTGAMECDRAYLRNTWLKQELPEGLYVYLEVSDSGCGMKPEVFERMFDPFYTTKFTGRGLGLAAVLGIVRGHKGSLKVYSEPGRGTTFKVLFPPASGDAVELPGASPVQKPWQGHGTLLLVDDEETVRILGKQMIERLGFRCLTAADGEEALDCFRVHADEITVVLLDLTMPHMDGEETFRELRRLKPDVRVVMSSGYNQHDVTQRFAGKGLAGFIQKPYRMALLTEVLRAAIEGTGGDSASG
jgi:PAS domain S-box-containing protein